MGITDLIIIMATSNGIIIGYWHPYKIKMKVGSAFIVDYSAFIRAPEYDNPKADFQYCNTLIKFFWHSSLSE